MTRSGSQLIRTGSRDVFTTCSRSLVFPYFSAFFRLHLETSFRRKSLLFLHFSNDFSERFEMRDHAFPCTGAVNPHVRVNLFKQNSNKNGSPFHTPLFVLFLWILARLWASLVAFWWSLFGKISKKKTWFACFFMVFDFSLFHCTGAAYLHLWASIFASFSLFLCFGAIRVDMFFASSRFSVTLVFLSFYALFNDFLTQS